MKTLIIALFIPFFGTSVFCQTENDVINLLDDYVEIKHHGNDTATIGIFKDSYFMILSLYETNGNVSMNVLNKYIVQAEEMMDYYDKKFEKDTSLFFFFYYDAIKALNISEIYYERGMLKGSKSDYYGARQDFLKSLELKGASKNDKQSAKIYYMLGAVEALLNNTEKACLHLSKAGELGLEKAYDMIRKLCN